MITAAGKIIDQAGDKRRPGAQNPNLVSRQSIAANLAGACACPRDGIPCTTILVHPVGGISRRSSIRGTNGYNLENHIGKVQKGFQLFIAIGGGTMIKNKLIGIPHHNRIVGIGAAAGNRSGRRIGGCAGNAVNRVAILGNQTFHIQVTPCRSGNRGQQVCRGGNVILA